MSQGLVLSGFNRRELKELEIVVCQPHEEGVTVICCSYIHFTNDMPKLSPLENRLFSAVDFFPQV